MSGTMPGLYKRKISIPKELYERLSDKTTEVVQRFYDLNQRHFSFWNIVSPFRTRVEINLEAASLVLEGKAKTQ